MGGFGDLLITVGRAWNDPARRRAWFSRLKRIHRGVFAAFFAALVGALVAIGWIGERNLCTAFLLFLPQQIWLLPLTGFVGTALLLWDWRLIGVIVAAGAAFVWFYLDWEITGPKAPRGEPALTVMTFNRGQRSGSLRPFKKAQKPDILAMQEGGGRSGAYLQADGYSDLPFGEDIGEFLLLSRFPIKSRELIQIPAGGRDWPVAAAFVVDFDGEEIVIYNVHLPTPRDQLLAMRRGAFLRGFWPSSPAARSYQGFWDGQIALAEGLLKHVRAESRPTIVVGDFNTPDRGYIYRLLTDSLQDAHEAAGTGFGWTFPGVTRNPLSGGGPWLRIDHQFADDNWRVLSSVAESGRKSQHLAVAARFERVADRR